MQVVGGKAIREDSIPYPTHQETSAFVFTCKTCIFQGLRYSIGKSLMNHFDWQLSLSANYFEKLNFRIPACQNG